MEIGSTQGQAGMAMLAKSLQESTVGADVISKTLNTMNQLETPSKDSNADYDFQTKVLMSHAIGKGAGLDVSA